jgi:hypothetical protein
VLGPCTFRYLAPQVSMVAIVTKSMVSSSLCRRASIVVGVTLPREDSNGRLSAVFAHNLHPISPRGFHCQRSARESADREPTKSPRSSGETSTATVWHTSHPEHGHPSSCSFCAIMHIIERRGQYKKMVHGNDLKLTAWCQVRRCR